MDQKLSSLRDQMNAHYCTPDADALAVLLQAAPDLTGVEKKAHQLVQQIRTDQKKYAGVDAFLTEYGLNTQEGVALMCLAEALLRIPDADTADDFIKDKIIAGNWESHRGKSPNFLVNKSSLGLDFTAAILDDQKWHGVFGVVQNVAAKLGEPVIRTAMRQAMKLMGDQFVMGENIESAVKRGAKDDGYLHSFDMLGEAARTDDDAQRYFDSYHHAIAKIGAMNSNRMPEECSGISVKLSALHPRFEFTKRDILMKELAPRLLDLCVQAKKYNINLCVDAEEADRLDLSLDVMQQVFLDSKLDGWGGFGLAVQAYQKRAFYLIDWLAALAKKSGKRMMVRLVKGAYWDTEIKLAQQNGHDGYPVFTRKAATDVSYLACAAKMINYGNDIFYPQFATHNAHTVTAVLGMIPKGQKFEFQRLHGMGQALYQKVKAMAPCRIYAPVGTHRDLLAYLVRRLLENGANSSFVNAIADERVKIDDIVACPVKKITQADPKHHPKIPLPENIFTDRQNSCGIGFGDPIVEQEFLKSVASFDSYQWETPDYGSFKNVISPANTEDVVGRISLMQKQDLQQALDQAQMWDVPVAQRAACLKQAADVMEENMPELIALLMREAGKTYFDAVAEVREAVDFCRYYAVEGNKNFGAPVVLPGPTGESNHLSYHPRGVFLCISPWNFPLAIFTGQVVAALMGGNAVLAKPAEQTSLIAARAVQMLHAAGVPENVMQVVVAKGSDVGKYLVPDDRIAGVCFTGSTATAKLINQTLATHDGAIKTLIAETGGQNVMMVDSSALPEQVVRDVIISAFQSAGQRCSALRVLYVQDEIADTVITMLKGAMARLKVGNPKDWQFDIGPVIDQNAQDMLLAHAKKMKKNHKLIYACDVDGDDGFYVPPMAFEISSIRDLAEEVFGPILHVVRYNKKNLDRVIDDINSAGYGLTFGVHSRVDSFVKKLKTNMHVGNIYVNRSMIGAMVGVQPFGGEGLSGTGPKAGGPNYLMRFVQERTVTVDTTATGGNASLLSLGG